MATASLRMGKRAQSASVWALYVVGLAPAAWAFYLGATGGLGADPVKTFELFLGLWAVRFLILTLAVSPLRDLFGWSLLRYRRALGLLTFYYALMHFAVYLTLDQGLDMGAVLEDVVKRPFIMFGMAGLIVLLPLALTSNMASIRALGKKWTWLHRAVHIAAALAILHFALATKVFGVEQSIYLALLLLMILYRSWRPIAKSRKRPVAAGRARGAGSTLTGQP
ncbi:protein-methionine-sulfoxide reductase heme-binding subunit MsrQ [Rhizobium sp. YIM 134829]|uniref:protein-methionine-sulfoxide reductase heme-binding subunit MsrQ n=1 Tax=Rhizobium sp. YIM 134829 TaxID=3390453 RepID=UPI00397AFA96